MTRIILLATLLVLATVCLSYNLGVQNRDVASTNGDRLARGLNPLKPKRLYDPSRVQPLAPRQSPQGSVQGYLAIFDSMGNLYCFIVDGCCNLPHNSQSGLFVYDTAVSRGPENIASDPANGFNGNLLTHPNSGSGYFSSTDTENFGSVSVGKLNTGPGAVPSGGFASAIWTVGSVMDSVALVTVKWINPDTSQITLGGLTDGTCLYLSGDPVGALNDRNNFPSFIDQVIGFIPI